MSDERPLGGSTDFAACTTFTRGSALPLMRTRVIQVALTLASTSRVEVNNLLARHKNGRLRRLCLAFSKTLRGHRAAVSL